MQKLLENLFRLDASGDMAGLHDFVVNNRYGADQIHVALQHLLINGRLRSAHVLSMMLDQSGHQHPFISLALCAGGLIHGKPEDEERGKKMLWAQTDAQSEAQQAFVNKTLLSPVVVALLNAVLPKSDTSLVIRVIEIVKAAAPTFRAIYDWNAPVPTLTLEGMRQRGREQARLLNNPLPPDGVPRVRRRVLMMMRQQRGYGVRLTVAMNAYGWQAETCEHALTAENVETDCRFIVETCRQKEIDLLAFDANRMVVLFESEQVRNAYREMKAQLLRETPSLKLLGMFIDSNDASQTVLDPLAEFFDGAVSHIPVDSFIKRNPGYSGFANKMVATFCAPINDRNLGTPDRPLVPQMFFSGTISSGHWTRALWLSAADHVGIPIRKKLNAFSYERPAYKNSPLDDYADYVREVAESTCCLSMLMLDNQQRYLVYRSFEPLLCGALQVQEMSPYMHNYFIPGEHYLEFSTIAELAAIARFIAERTEEAEEIRRCGNAFARAHYRDERVVGHIDKFLYFPD